MYLAGVKVGSHHLEFIHLKVFNNGTNRLEHGWYMAAPNSLIENCDIYDNAGYGIQIYSSGGVDNADNTIIRNNRIHDNRGDGGVTLNHSANIQFYNNLVYNNANGVAVSYGNPINTQIYNNTIYNHLGEGIGIGAGSSGTLIRNNILFQNAPAINNSGTNTTFSNNLCSSSGTGCSVIGNPLFVNAAANDFHLTASSPAVNAGTTISTVITDFDGVTRPQGAAYDIGAYEYASGGTGDTTPPSTPGSLTATAVSSSQVNLSWNASTDNVGVTGYRVERCTGASCLTFAQIATPSGTTYSDTGLTASTAYRYRVRASDAAGNLSSYSSIASATTQSGGGTTITIGETNILPLGDSGNGNLLLAQQATLSQTATIQSLSFYVSSAAGQLRLGIYDATGPSGGPGALKAQTAAFTPTTGWNTQSVTSQVSLAPGTYWLAYNPSDSNLAFVRDGTGSLKYYSYAFNTLPATFSTAPTSGTDHWSFYATLSTAPAFDFSLSNSGNDTVTQGQSVNKTITATLSTGTAQPVSFSASGLPTGATASFSPTSCSPSCTTTMTITTQATTPTGASNVTITGTAGALTRTTNFTLTVSAATGDVTSGLVSKWTFDNTANDSVGTNHGTLQNGPTYAAGKIGQAIQLDGVDDYVNIGDPANGSLDFGATSFSYGMWLYVTAPASEYDMPWNKGGACAGCTGYDMEFGNGGWVSNIADGDEVQGITVSSSPILNRWVYVTVVVDRANSQVRAYVDGALVGSNAISSTFGSVSNTSAATIGRQSEGGYNFAGLIDDVRIYNCALSQSEVTTLYTYTGGTASPAISASPASLSGGSQATVTVANGPANTTDWVGLYKTSAPPEDGTWVNLISWQHLNGTQTPPATGLSGATLSFTMPATPDTYEFRFFNGTNTALLATSNSVTVTAPTGTTIFSDNFDASQSWTPTGDVTWYTGTPHNGTHAIRLRATGSIDKSVSLAGYQNVTLSFQMGANSLDSSAENLQALYWDGTTWQVAAQIDNGSANENNLLNPYTITLPAAVNNLSSFALRFKLNGSSTNDQGYVDDVTVTGTAIPLAPDTTAPTTPTNVTSTGTSGSTIALAWSASTDPQVAGQTTSGVASYEVFRNGTSVGTSATPTFTDTGLQPLTTYSYTVKAKDNANNTSAASAAFSQSTESSSVIAPPTPTVTVTLATAQGATTYYTTDGSTPTQSSTLYSAPFPVADGMTVKARSFQQGATPSPVVTVIGSATTGTGTLSVGSPVRTTASLNVRATASTSGTLLGSQPTGATGTITQGPTTADGYTWWYVDYANAPDGWSAGNWLVAN